MAYLGPVPGAYSSIRNLPADWLLPFVHQRYDDLSVLGK